nr:natalisin [Schistocerca gregaria]
MPHAVAWAWLAAAATLALARQGPDSENATLAEDSARGRVKRAGVPEAGLADDGRSRRQEPLYVEEPAWVLLDRRETLGPARQAVAAAVAAPAGVGDAFWVARGRRREMSASSASAEGPFWAARGRREMEFFWPARGKRDQEEVMVGGSGEEEDAGLAGEWEANRNRRAGLRSYLASMSGGQSFVPARGKRGSPHAGVSKRETGEVELASRRASLGSESVEGPFWAPRGRRGQAARLLRLRLASAPAGSAFWPARGRRAGPSSASSSAEGPFWATRGRSLAAQHSFWPARGRRGDPTNDRGDAAETEGEDSDNAEDRSFWEKLHEKDQARTHQ